MREVMAVGFVVRHGVALSPHTMRRYSNHCFIANNGC